MQLVLILLLSNAASCWFMTGLIWFVQVVHYPQFSRVGAESFIDYHERHTRLTTWVVGPPMLVELFSAVFLVLDGSLLVSNTVAWIGLILLAVVWLSTALLQVPKHNTLASGWNPVACSVLCSTNWIRTVAWSARAMLMLYAVWHVIEINGSTAAIAK